ncbi:MAG: gamma-glutamylcyclotransferase family protein [Woeseiaceae bacterium]|nr:gamma-glutamylcyclotransferase family protein [Woeseiaceae bacterium]
MTTKDLQVFFYGLFMDESLLASKGVHATDVMVGHVDGYSLRIGERASLVPDSNGRAYGVLMAISSDDAAVLYSDPSVADYVVEPVVVTLSDDTQVAAACYNLPADKLAGTNADYASTLWALATKLGLPESYLDEIRKAV